MGGEEGGDKEEKYMKTQKYCNQKIDLDADDGYEKCELKCRELYGHKLPHRTKIPDDKPPKYIYWSEGTS